MSFWDPPDNCPPIFKSPPADAWADQPGSSSAVAAAESSVSRSAASQSGTVFKRSLNECEIGGITWTLHAADDGTPYYFNQASQEAQWDPPTDWMAVPELVGDVE